MQDSGGRRRRSPRTSSSSSSKSNESPGGCKQGTERTQQRDSGSQNRKGNFTKGHKNIHRTSSHDHVRKLVEKEGRTARNLIAYSVPLSDNESEERNKRSKLKSHRRNRSYTAEKSGSSEREGSPREALKSPSRSRSSSRKGSGSLSGRAVDLRARYWNYLFENLKRAVDEIYSTCEADESIVECQEVIMMLEQCRRDFSALIDRINVQDAFEKAEYNDRPTSLAWEVRKSSPGKTLVPSPVSAFQPAVQRTSSTSPVRNLGFSSQPAEQYPAAPAEAGEKPLSWADKVKGTPPAKASCARTPHQNASETSKPNSVDKRLELIHESRRTDDRDSNDSDSEGWETVHHGKKPSDGTHKQARSRRKQAPDPGKEKGRHAAVGRERGGGGIPAGSRNSGHASSVTYSAEAPNGNKSTESNSRSSDVETPPSVERVRADTSPEQDEVEQDNASDEEHEKAICAALEQEESLNKEYEEMQQRTIQSAMEHEASLTEEIAKEEAFLTALNGQCDTPDLEMDEVEEEGGAGEAELTSSLNASDRSLTWDEMVANYDATHASGQSLSWGDIVDQSEGRSPGRAVQMHQKLSSPSRKKPLAEVIRIHEEKQAKAQHQRERLLDERLNKLQMLSEKVLKVQELKEELIQEQQNHLWQKQERAEQQRLLVLQEKIRKAKGEEAKVNEIAFINTLEAQNKKIEVMTRHQGHEARLQDIQEERQRKKEEQQAKEAAAQERRRQLEAERLARLEEVQQKKLEQEAKYKREKLERERAREEAAKEKAREREMRLAARNEALQTATEQLQLKIQQKQTETMRRHEHQLEQVKEKAAGVSKHSTQDEVPAVTPYDQKKMCSLCNVEIISEVYLLSHLRGKKHQTALANLPGSKAALDDKEDTVSLQYIKEMSSEKAEEKEKAEQERQKALRKRAKKLRTRMAAKGREYESNLQNVPSKRLDSAKKPRLQKLVKDMNRILQAQGSGPWAANRVATLERSAGELNRILESKVTADQVTLCHVGGLAALLRVLLVIDVTSEKPPAKPIIPNKALCSVTQVVTLACADCLDNSRYMVYTNKLAFIVDLFLYRYKNFCVDDGKKAAEKEGAPQRPPGDPLASALLGLLASVLQCFATASPEVKESAASVQRMVDLLSYVVCSGVVEEIRDYFELLQGPFHEEPTIVEFVKAGMKFLSATTQYLSSRSNGVFEKKKEDPTQFVLSTKETELVGTVSLLYAMLLHIGGQPRHLSPPPTLQDSTITITTEALSTLNNLATVDLATLQASLGAEGVSLEFRHIVSYILWICSDGKHEDLLHEVILVVGYFTVLNQDNQVFVQSGRNPTLLQQLCALPFQYFSDPRLRNVLFPTLICSCFENEENKKIVEQEVSCALLENFLEEKALESQEEELLPSQSARHYDGELSQRFSLSNRFPQSKWTEAAKYFRASK